MLQSPTCALDQHNQSIRNFVPTTALRGIRHVMAERHDKPQRAFNHTQRKHIFGSSWVECTSFKCVSVSSQPCPRNTSKKRKTSFHVGGLLRPIQSLYMVPGWEATGRRLWDCIDASLCNDMNASLLTRLYGQADFQGPPLELVEKVQNAILKEFALEPVATIKPPFGLPQHCPCRHLVWCDAGGQRPRCRHYPGLVGTRCTAGHGQKDRNHRRFPAGRQARQGRRLTNPRCVRATHGWRRALQIRARKLRRCTQGVRQISGSPNHSGHRQDHSRTSLPKGAHQQIGADHQRVTRKEESAPGCGHEAVQAKRTSSSARAANPASPVRRCGRYCHVLVHPDELKNCLVAALLLLLVPTKKSP